MICTSLTCLRRTSQQWCFLFLLSVLQSQDNEAMGNDSEPPDLSKSKATPLRMGFSQKFFVRMYEPSLCPMTSYSAVFWGSTGLNVVSIRFFQLNDDLRVEVNRVDLQNFATILRCRARSLLSYKMFYVLRCFPILFRLPFDSMLSLWIRPWTASNKEIGHAGPIGFVGKGVMYCNFLLSEWRGWWEKSGFWKSLKVICICNYR